MIRFLPFLLPAGNGTLCNGGHVVHLQGPPGRDGRDGVTITGLAGRDGQKGEKGDTVGKSVSPRQIHVLHACMPRVLCVVCALHVNCMCTTCVLHVQLYVHVCHRSSKECIKSVHSSPLPANRYPWTSWHCWTQRSPGVHWKSWSERRSWTIGTDKGRNDLHQVGEVLLSQWHFTCVCW